MSCCHKLIFLIHIFATQCCRPSIFKTIISVRNVSLHWVKKEKKLLFHMQKWFALSNFNSFYEVSQNMFIFKLVNYTMIISSDLYLKRAKLDSQWYRVYLYLINDLKIPAFSYLVNVIRTCHSINGRSLKITSLVP